MPPAPPPQQNANQKAQAQSANNVPPVDLSNNPLYIKTKAKRDSDNEAKANKRAVTAQNRAARSSRRVVVGAVTVQGAILGSIIGSVILLAIMVSLGPLVDFFQAWLMNQPGNPYAAPILDMFPWIYIFIFASWVVYIIAIWRAATQQGSYGVYD